MFLQSTDSSLDQCHAHERSGRSFDEDLEVIVKWDLRPVELHAYEGCEQSVKH